VGCGFRVETSKRKREKGGNEPGGNDSGRETERAGTIRERARILTLCRGTDKPANCCSICLIGDDAGRHVVFSESAAIDWGTGISAFAFTRTLTYEAIRLHCSVERIGQCVGGRQDCPLPLGGL